MERLSEVKLQDLAVNFAGAYIEAKFKNGRDIEKSLILNTVAHGYYIGARRAEEIFAEKWWRIFSFLIPDPQEWRDTKIDQDAIKASKVYIRKKRYQKMSFGELALIRASLCTGFNAGFRKRLYER